MSEKQRESVLTVGSPEILPVPPGVEIVDSPYGVRFRGPATDVAAAVQVLRSLKDLPEGSQVALGGWILQVSDYVQTVSPVGGRYDPQIVTMPGNAWNVAASILRDACYGGSFGNPCDFGDVGFLNPKEEPDIGVELVGPLLVDESRSTGLKMASTTHAITLNGRIHAEVKGTDGSVEEEICRYVRSLDGIKRFSLRLWRMPPGRPMGQVDTRSWPQEYLQCAGGADRMTVEIRKIVAHVPAEFVIGRPDNPVSTTVREIISWDGRRKMVYPHEVFNLDEVCDLFEFYFLNGDCPPDSTRRKLDF